MLSLGSRGRRPRRLAGRAFFAPRYRSITFMVAVSRNRASFWGQSLVLAVAFVATVSARQGQTSSSSSTAPQGTSDSQATFRSRIDSVMVDVSVTDKQGNPV